MGAGKKKLGIVDCYSFTTRCILVFYDAWIVLDPNSVLFGWLRSFSRICNHKAVLFCELQFSPYACFWYVIKTGLLTLPLLHAQRDDMSHEIILVPVQICVNRISVIFNSGLILIECRLQVQCKLCWFWSMC
jgi:hypothetical protein